MLRQAFLTLALASAPALLLAIPALLVAAGASSHPLLAFAAGAVPLAGVMLLAGSAGVAAALLLVRLVPPRRARLLAAFLSATGLAVALVGFRAARPERLLDPVEALSVVTRLGVARPSSPALNPAAWAARAATRGILGDAGGLVPGAVLFFAGVAGLFLVPATLWRLHLHVFRDAWPGSAAPTGRSRRGPEARSVDGVLMRSETASLLRDASTPAQLGSLAAVFLLDLMNVRLLPATDATQRDLVAGLQTGLSLFLVSALSLRFAYPSVSSDGRAALVLRTLPLDPRRHLLARWAVRALLSAGVALALTAGEPARPPARKDDFRARARRGAGREPRNPGAPRRARRPVPALRRAERRERGAVLGKLSRSSSRRVSRCSPRSSCRIELRLLLGALLKIRLSPGPVLLFFLASAAAAAIAPMAMAARSLERRDISIG